MRAPRIGDLIPFLGALGALGACDTAGSGSRPADPAPAEAPIVELAAASDPARAFAALIEEAHGVEAWRRQAALAGHITVDFGGETILDARMTFTTDAGKSRLDLADGTVAVFDGERAWVSPPDAELQPVRFHVLTWPYFLAAPSKLRDPGTRLEPLGERPLRGGPHPAARLSFAAGVGDTPDDWYVVHGDPATGRLAAMGYVVTYGRSQEVAEAEPHAITYETFERVDGALVPTSCRFWNWNEEEGLVGEPIGRLVLKDPAFVEPEPGAFEAPEGAREDALPAP